MTPFLLLALTLAAPVPKDQEAPPPKFDGVWVVKSREFRGVQDPVPDALKPNYALVVSGDDYAFRYGGGTIKTDPAKQTVEMTVTAGQFKGQSLQGVFERTGDTLRVALPRAPGQPAATELKTTETSTHAVYTFERDKTVAAEKLGEKLKERLAASPVAGGVGAPAVRFGGVAPAAGAVPTAAQLRQALERIEKLEKAVEQQRKRIDELERKK